MRRERDDLGEQLKQLKAAGAGEHDWVRTEKQYDAACRRYARGKKWETAEEVGRRCQQVCLEADGMVDARKAWAETFRLRRGQQTKVERGLPAIVKDEDGEYILDPRESAARWTSMGEELAQQPEGNPLFDQDNIKATRREEARLAQLEKVGEVPSADEGEWASPDIEEVRKLLQGLPNGSSAGPDTIPYELLKYSGETGLHILQLTLGLAWRWEVQPKHWDEAAVAPLYKPGKTDVNNVNNYRRVTLLNTAAKLYEGWLAVKMAEKLQETNFISTCQGAHRPGTGCHELASALHSGIRLRAEEEGKRTYVAFVDIKTAFPASFRELVWVKLWHAGVRGKLWRTTRNLFNKAKSRVLHPYIPADEFYEVHQGLREGSKLSPILFNVLVNSLEEELREANLGAWLGDDIFFGCFQFSDDVALCADSPEELQRMLDFFQDWCARHVLQINHDKTEIMHFFGVEEDATREYAMTGGDGVKHNIRVVQKFKYLGIWLDDQLSMQALTDNIKRNVIIAHHSARRVGVKPGGLELGSRLVAWKTLVLPHLTSSLAFLPSWQMMQLKGVYADTIRETFAPDGVVTCIQADLGLMRLEELHMQATLRLYGQLQGCPADRIPARVHARAKHDEAPLGLGLEGVIKSNLERMDWGNLWPVLTRPGAQGERRRFGWDEEQDCETTTQQKKDKRWWKEEVMDRLVERRGEWMWRELAKGRVGCKRMYADIVGRRGVFREEPFKAAEWLAAETPGWGRQRLLEYRVQGSRMIDSHAREGEWKWGRWRWGMGARVYADRFCSATGCTSSDGFPLCGNEVHIFLFCTGRSKAREACLQPLIEFWQQFPLWDPAKEQEVRWMDLTNTEQIALILGESMPGGLRIAGGYTAEAWRRSWGKVAGTIRRQFELARRGEKADKWEI